MEQIFSSLAEGFDLPVLDWIRENLQCSFLDQTMPVLTRLGDVGIFWIITAVVMLCFSKTRRTGLAVGFSLLLGLLLCNLTLKPLCARIRPYDYQLENFGVTVSLLIDRPSEFSFPSGHTIASFEAATALMLCNKKFGIPALVLAVLIAFSRLYLYVHYPSDVIASVILGVGLGALGTYLAEKLPKGKYLR